MTYWQLPKGNQTMTNSLKSIGHVRIFEPVVIGMASFAVCVCYDTKNNKMINADDLLTSLGIKKANLKNKTYYYLNKFDLQLNEDYIVRPGDDPIVSEPIHALTISAAKKIAQDFEGDLGKAALRFLELVEVYTENDVFRHFCCDSVVLMPVFTFKTVSTIFQGVKYNDGIIDEEKFIKMLKRDKILTRASLPVKGYEMMFSRINNETCLTVQGFNYLTRKYLGLPLDVSINFTLENMPFASRKVSTSMFSDDRIERVIPTEDEVIVSE